VLQYLLSSKIPVVVIDVWTDGQAEGMKLFVSVPNLAKYHKSQFLLYGIIARLTKRVCGTYGVLYSSLRGPFKTFLSPIIV